MSEVYISVDCEATGPIPGLTEYSMYELGACVVGEPSKKSLGYFMEIKILNDNFIPEALTACGKTLEGLKSRPGAVDPVEAMCCFEAWLLNACAGRRPVFVGFNATFDWMFVNWYFHKFLGRNSFGISGLDIKAYYMGMMNVSWGETTKRRLDPRFKSAHPHTHNALDDAVEQAEVFQKMREYNNQFNKRS